VLLKWYDRYKFNITTKPWSFLTKRKREMETQPFVLSVPSLHTHSQLSLISETPKIRKQHACSYAFIYLKAASRRKEERRKGEKKCSVQNRFTSSKNRSGMY